jgi:diacylglycerol kinase family enzyme
VKTVFLYKNQTITFTANNETTEREVFLVAIGNGKAMGGGFFLTPQAEIDDGLLDICIIRALSKREVLLNLPKAIHGKHTGLEQVEMLRAEKVRIQSENGIAVHADGELLGMDLKNLEISVIPAALEVITG